MGVEVVRKLPLPAPTESSAVQTSAGSITEAATDLSTRTDKTSVTLPEDGTSIAIATRKRRDKRSRDHDSTVTRASNQSQTSFLIEFFEGGKGPTRSRPSFRVKVTPPAARKAKDSSDHLQITAGSSRKPSYMKCISLPPAETSDARSSISSYTSAADDSSLGGRDQPLEIEIMHHDQGSDLSARSASRHRYTDLGSEVSSMPPDSMLEGTQGSVTPVRERSRSFSKDAAATSNMLKTPSRRDRSLSKERLAQQVAEKIEGKSKDSNSGRRRHGSKQRSPSVSSEQSSVMSGRHKRSRHHEEDDLVSNAESSVVTTSQLSPRRTSGGDQYSIRSGTSKSSINNPKLIETVEEAIRRLILPELNNLKHEQKMQQNRQGFESNTRESPSGPSGSTPVGTSGLFRRVSKHASAPDVTKPKALLNRNDYNSGQITSGDSIKGRKYERDIESPSDRFQREMSAETVIHSEDPRKNTRDGHWFKDAAGGGLASPALKHHDSRSSVDKRERRRRRSKSHSRSASLAESSEDIFSKHDVPPMPMRSDIYGSEVTRDSLLSERSDDPASPSERRRAEIRQVSRGSGREVISPGSRTPTRTPINSRKGLGTHYSNRSRGDLSIHSVHSGGSIRDEKRLSMAAEVFDSALGADVAVADHLSQQNHDHNDHDEHTYAHRARARASSPIQSVASNKGENEVPNRNSLQQTHSSGSISSMDQGHGKASGMSINSLSSAASTKIARQSRPKGINLENEKDVLEQHDLLHDGIADTEDWYERQHQQNDRYRQSFGSSNFRDSTEIKGVEDLNTSLHNKDTGTPTTPGMGGNVQYIHVPHGVESAVASLMDPSILSERPNFEYKSLGGSVEDHYGELNEVHEETLRNLEGTDNAHQPHHTQSIKDLHDSRQHSGASSPRQSETRSLGNDDDQISFGATGVPVSNHPMPEIGIIPDGSESDLVTNPPEINGPIGGLNESRDRWHYQPTPPQSKHEIVAQSNEQSTNTSLKAAANGMLSVAALAQQEKEYQKTGNHSRELSLNDGHSAADRYSPINHDFGPIHDTYMSNQPMIKDEGYGSAPPGMSPEPRQKSAALFTRKGLTNIDDLMADDDPFVSNPRNASGNSHGMPSPLYDSATGGGIDRIQSKDIVALMDHLTVRDAQRNARDTEILVTLVRSAAEMRTSFDDMKKFIAEQDEMLVETGNKQHDRTTQKILGGPRPQPAGASRARRATADDDYDDLPAKRRSVFKRALKGFSGRNFNDYAKIEEMFLQLLGEIEGLKNVPDVRPSAHETRPGSLGSYDQLRAAGPDGYEPEGQAGTSSTGDHSGYFSNTPSRQPNDMRNAEVRRGSQNRISTVLEGDEEDSQRKPSPADEQFEPNNNNNNNNNNVLTPTRDFARGGSVPLDTPPQVHIPTGAVSNENTPKTGTDRSRKHKSSSSSFFPKMSRWSKTTASSVPENFNKGTSRGLDRPISDASRSGSDGQQYNANDTYDPHGDDRLRSNESFARAEDRENRPPSPLIPSQVSERPKYQAQRDSLNLQHPQPRIGPTQRYHTNLESQAHTFGSPISPTSDQWGSNPSLARFPPGPGNRHSGGAGNLSPISDADYSELSVADKPTGSPRASPRPKPRDDGPLIPSARSSVKSNRPKFASPLSSEHLAPEQRHSNATGYEQGNGSPRSASNLLPQRKPTGPRPITSSGHFSPDKGLSGIKQNRYRGSPNRIGSPLEQQYTF